MIDTAPLNRVRNYVLDNQKEGLEVLYFRQLASLLLKNLKPMPAEFSKIVDEHFWELIDNPKKAKDE